MIFRLVNLSEKQRFRICGSLATLFVVGLFGMERCAWSQEVSLDPWYFTMGADLVVDHEPIHLYGTFECKISSDGYWHRNHHAMSGQLSNGAGILVLAPDLCASRKIPAEYLPLVFWVDDIHSPSHIESFIDQSQTLDGSGKVQVKSASIQQASAPASNEAWGFADIDVAGRHSPAVKWPGAQFVGFAAATIPNASWEAVDNLKAPLSQIDVPTMLRGPILRSAIQQFSRIDYFSGAVEERVFWFDQKLPIADDLKRYAREMFGLRLSSDGQSLRNDRQGIAVFAPRSKIKVDSSGNYTARLELPDQIENATISPYSYAFLPEKQELIGINEMTVLLLLNPTYTGK